MIAFFPDLYPDELLYSAISRYYDKSGYGIYRAAAEDIYQNRLTNPDVLFINPITQELKTVLIRQKSWNEIIEHHTMYPHYARFLPQGRRRRAFQSLMNMDFKHKDALQMPKDGRSDSRYLSYCPACCLNDRELFGETYWHREHQLPGVDACPYHSCYLINSEIPIGKKSPGLYSAETSISDLEIKQCDDKKVQKLSIYIAELFRNEIVDTNINYHEFLHEKVAGTKYTSPRGEQKNVALFFNDFMNYYKDYANNPISELWEFKKIVDGKKYNTMEISMVAMFIGVAPNDLTQLRMPQELHQEAFDRKIKELHEQGLKYPQIAEIMGVSYDYCKSIGGGRNRKYNRGRTVNNGGVKSRDWEEYDRELLPKVKEAIEAIHSGKEDKPKRVTINAVANYIGITAKRFDNLNLCREEIRKFSESIEEYWAREMVFFYKQLEKEKKSITVTALMNLTNTRRQNLVKGILYLKNYTDADTAEIIKTVVTPHG